MSHIRPYNFCLYYHHVDQRSINSHNDGHDQPRPVYIASSLQHRILREMQEANSAFHTGNHYPSGNLGYHDGTGLGTPFQSHNCKDVPLIC